MWPRGKGEERPEKRRRVSDEKGLEDASQGERKENLEKTNFEKKRKTEKSPISRKLCKQ